MLYITFIHLRYVKNAVVPKFSDIGYYIFMTINFDIGLLKSIFPVITRLFYGVCYISCECAWGHEKFTCVLVGSRLAAALVQAWRLCIRGEEIPSNWVPFPPSRLFVSKSFKTSNL